MSDQVCKKKKKVLKINKMFKTEPYNTGRRGKMQLVFDNIDISTKVPLVFFSFDRYDNILFHERTNIIL